MVQPENAYEPIERNDSGKVIDCSIVQSLNSSDGIEVIDVKYWNSSKDLITLYRSKTPLNDFAAAASLYETSPSPSVSNAATQAFFTFASAKTIGSLEIIEY